MRGLGQQYSQTGGRWLWAGANRKIERWEFGAPEVISTTFGTYVADATATQRPTFYDFTPYGDWMIVNGGYPGEAAYIHKPAVPSFDVYAAGQAPVGVVQFLKMMSFMMALGYGARGTQVGWSDANNIELWVPATDNTAGSLSIDEFNTPIRAGCKLGDAVAVYSEDQLALVRYIGEPFIFGQKTTIDGIGAIGKAAVATDTRVNVGVSRSGVWWTDGISSRYIDEGYLSNYLQDNVNWLQGAKIAAARNDYTGCFEFTFPMLGSNVVNETWAWDPKTGGWSKVSVWSVMDERRLFEHPVQGLNNGQVHLSDFVNPVPVLPLVLETKPLIMQTAESPHVVTRIDEVDLFLHKARNLELALASAATPLGPWEWSEWQTVEAGAPVTEVPELPEAPFWKLALRTQPGYEQDWDIDLQGFLLYGTTVGSAM